MAPISPWMPWASLCAAGALRASWPLCTVGARGAGGPGLALNSLRALWALCAGGPGFALDSL